MRNKRMITIKQCILSMESSTHLSKREILQRPHGPDSETLLVSFATLKSLESLGKFFGVLSGFCCASKPNRGPRVSR